MKIVFIQTVTGKDRTHLIKEMAEVTRSVGGEWLKTKLVRLHQQFAAMMMVSIDQAKEAELKSALEKGFPELYFSYARIDTEAEAHATSATVVADCQDRPGLTQEITKILSDLNLEAENMEFHRLPVTPVGGTVYTARMTVLFPDEASKEELLARLESVSDCTSINFE